MPKTKKQKYAVGVDLGGTNVVVVLMSEAGKVIADTRFSTRADKGPDFVIKNISENVKVMINKAKIEVKDVTKLGIGAPGPLDSKKGIVLVAPNMPGWKNIKLKDDLEKYLKIKAGVENDANCATFAEKWIGAGKNADNVVGFTLGTGVGGGIVIDGKLLRGVTNTAAELGHITVELNGRECGCGSKGCLETYASATGIARTAVEMIKQGRQSIITEMVKGSLSKITSKLVYEALVQKDKLAEEVWISFIRYLAAGVASVINVLNPEVIVIAGGVINAGEKLFAPLLDETRKRAFAAPFAACKILPAKLGEMAGAIGAAGIVIFEGDYYGI